MRLCQFAGATGRFAGAGRIQALAQELLGDRGILLQIAADLVVDDPLDEPLDLAVAELCLRLPFELRVPDLDADHTGQSLAQVFPFQGFFPVFQEVAAGGVVVERPRQGRAEADQVRSPLRRVDAVGKGKNVFRVGVVILESHLDHTVLSGAGDEDRILVKDLLAPVDVLDKGDDSPFVEILALAINPLVDQRDLHPGIQKRKLPQPVRHGVVVKLRILENRVVRFEGDGCSPAFGLAYLLQRGVGHAADVGLGIDAAIPPHF